MPTILGELKHYFRDAGWAVRVERGAAERARAVTAAAAELSAPRPTVEQLAQYLEWPLEDVVEGLQAAEAHDAVSLEVTTAGRIRCSSTPTNGSRSPRPAAGCR